MPSGGIVAVMGAPGSVVTAVRVRPGDPVKSGDLLMTIFSDSIKADQDLAALDLQGAKKVAEAQIAAQKLAVDVAQQRVREADREVEAYKALGPRATTANEAARLEAAQAQARLAVQIEQAKLETVKTETDRAIQAAQSRLSLAKLAMEIHAPSDGTILKVDRRIGQRLGPEAAIQMGDLRTMYVTCQVYQGDLLQLKPGMKATIKNAALANPIGGTVEEIGRIVDTRSRLGEVRIKLDSVDPANRLVGMEVEVVIAR